MASAATYVPAPARVSTSPSFFRAAIASRTLGRLTSSARARSRSEGRRVPGASTPLAISPRNRSAIWS